MSISYIVLHSFTTNWMSPFPKIRGIKIPPRTSCSPATKIWKSSKTLGLYYKENVIAAICDTISRISSIVMSFPRNFANWYFWNICKSVECNLNILFSLSYLMNHIYLMHYIFWIRILLTWIHLFKCLCNNKCIYIPNSYSVFVPVNIWNCILIILF